MNIKKTLLGLALVFASQSALAVPTFNLIQNGGFESSSFSGDFATYVAGSSALTGWTIESNSIDLINNYWAPASGSYSLDLSGNEDGIISQVFNTTQGQTYHVSFSLAGNPDDSDKIKYVQVGLSNEPLYSFDATGYSHGNMGWVTKGFDFIATGSTSKLFFSGAQDTASGVALDDISVTAVPEPESYALFLTGIALIAGIARRRSDLLK